MPARPHRGGERCRLCRLALEEPRQRGARQEAAGSPATPAQDGDVGKAEPVSPNAKKWRVANVAKSMTLFSRGAADLGH